MEPFCLTSCSPLILMRGTSTSSTWPASPRTSTLPEWAVLTPWLSCPASAPLSPAWTTRSVATGWPRNWPGTTWSGTSGLPAFSNCVRCTAPSWIRRSGAGPQGTSRAPGTPSLAICRTCWLPRRRRNKAPGLQICRRTQTHGAVPLDPLHTRTRMRTRHCYSS